MRWTWIRRATLRPVPPTDLAAICAAEFPDRGPGIYLNAASFGLLPLRCLEAVESFHRLRNRSAGLPERLVGETLESARTAVADLIGATPDEVALMPRTSSGLELAAGILARARGRPFGPFAGGRRILLSDREFPANVYPWLSLEREGMTVEFVATDPLGRPREEALLERLHEADDIACFALSFVQFSNGYRADLARFGKVCRERGILFVVDAIQGLGAVPLDVRASGADILASGGQKWLCSPFGTGFVYVRRELCSELEPLFPAWTAFEASADHSRILDYRYELVRDAWCFDAGMMGFQDFAGFARSVEFIAAIGVETIWRHILEVQAPLVEWLRTRDDVEVVSDLAEERRSGILCIRPPRAAQVYDALHEAGIVCGFREGAIRLAPHFYNTVTEMERVVEALEAELGR